VVDGKDSWGPEAEPVAKVSEIVWPTKDESDDEFWNRKAAKVASDSSDDGESKRVKLDTYTEFSCHNCFAIYVILYIPIYMYIYIYVYMYK